LLRRPPPGPCFPASGEPLARHARVWFDEHGAESREGARHESVSALGHAPQCAQRAGAAGAI